jgi:alkanesulfonate monooxygenase
MPRFELEGQTAETAFVAIRQGDCLWRQPHRPNQVYADALPVLHFDKEVGLVAFVIARRTREEALEAAFTLLVQDVPDPTRWITPCLWLGIDRGVLAGSFEEVARAILEFRSKGISQIMVRDWPGRNEITDFAANLLPLVRAMESGKAN